MPEPKPQKTERRPAHIPPDWPTRQQAQMDLNLRSPYGLVKLLNQLQPTEQDFQVVGKTGYISPALIERMRLELAEVEDIRDLPNYKTATDACAEIGCGFEKFARLLEEYAPSVHLREVVKARNRNSEITPVYSSEYIEKLKTFYTPSQPKPSTKQVDRASQPGASAAIVEPMLRRIEATPESVLVNPDQAERQALLSRVTTVLNALENVARYHQSDRQFDQLRQQLSMAATALRGTDPMPQGIGRLFEQAQRFINRDEED